MTFEPVQRLTGIPLAEWIQRVPNELEIDGVGLWQVIPALRVDFGLSGGALEAAARQVIENLLARGARPVVTASPEDGYWKEVNQYGETPAEIIDSVIAEWHRMGRDPHPGDLWFAHPSLYGDP